MNIKNMSAVITVVAVSIFGLINGGSGTSISPIETAKDKIARVKNIATETISGESDSVKSNAPTNHGFVFPEWGENSFYSSKKVLKEITKRHPESFYCGCDIEYESKSKLVPDFSKCGFKFRKNENRANRMEAEHIVPISWYGHNLQCWQEGGRSNCGKVSDKFKKAEGDLVNLQYAIGEVNGDRSNFRYGQWNGGGGQYGACDAKVDFKNDRFQPREEIRGHIARVHLYMQAKYGVQLSNSQNQLIKAWSKVPPTDWECEYNDILRSRYGSDAGNPYSTYACKVHEEWKAQNGIE